MKKSISLAATALLVALLLPSLWKGRGWAQNVGISSTGIVPDASAGLDISFNNKGLLIPRVSLTSTTDVITIATPATSLLVYNTNTAMTGGNIGYWYWDGAKWVQLLNGGSPGTAWTIFGNTGTIPSTSAIGTPIGAGQNYIGTTDANDFVIGTTNLERMRITAGGNVGLGTTSPTYKLHVVGKIKTDNINETSDIRYKTNINTIGNALEKTLALRGVFFNWDTIKFPDRNFSADMQVGLIAQETEKVFPVVVDTDKEGYKSIEYSKIVALLIEAVKEQNIKVTTLEKQTALLKATLDGLLNKNEEAKTEK